MNIKFKRILLKISGEALSQNGEIFSLDVIDFIGEELKKILDLGVKVGIVIGGGNIFRGKFGEGEGFRRIVGDYVGMMATVMNSLILSERFKKFGINSVVFSGIEAPLVKYPVDVLKAKKLFDEGKVIFFGGGTSNPYFTTDSAAALRAVEMNCDLLVKATKVDGLYDRDPVKFKDAKLIKLATYNEVIERDLNVMDLTAFSMCKEYDIKIAITNLFAQDNLLKIVKGENPGSFIQ